MLLRAVLSSEIRELPEREVLYCCSAALNIELNGADSVTSTLKAKASRSELPLAPRHDLSLSRPVSSRRGSAGLGCRQSFVLTRHSV
eukprot:scaffold93248_cov38-Phaeocystis_antarctica.AAC.1